ncbi:MAG TPA: UbiX family flavin prenyltransferase [Acidimicrobiia bacterium]|jgi:4-hydroxy-3-polyprenylbenzoate decarboxylase|nr:UbiX family flavin prenyltransferase [Acidimicrobiia bacterium]
MRVIVGISGATGAIYGIRLLEVLRDLEVETELIISEWGARNVRIETSYDIEEVKALATVTHPIDDQAAAVSSGSHRVDAMFVVPCSMRTLACIATGTGDNLIHRSADVVLKERKPLVLATRETPLNEIHLENMLKLSRMGVSIMPPMPAFYNRPESLQDLIDHFVARLLDQVGLETDLTKRWRTPSRGRDDR